MKRLLKTAAYAFFLTLFLYSCNNIGGNAESGDYRTDAVDDAAPMIEAEEMDRDEPAPEPTAGEGYDEIIENDFLDTKDEPLSTFSVDVDRASYSNVRRFLTQGSLPPKNAVRIEEMINYFKYSYPQPTDAHPISINTEYATCPWNTSNRLALVGLQGKLVDTENVPPMNLVFLIDVSGSMGDDIAMMKEAFKMLTDRMRKDDRIAIVVYAGASGLVLNSTTDKGKIKAALNKLQAGGSTAGAEGINLAYKVAKDNFIEGGNNRVILATDGDFNVGVSSDEALVQLIEKKRDEGVFLSVLGFGMGNYQDSKMEKLADNGNGNYAYIDNLEEAKKVFVTEMSGTLYTIAKDVKLQIEFDPKYVKSYRLIGYENRVMANEDFDNDAKDAGDIGAGHTVTAIYEIVPARNTANQQVMNFKFRYKQPDADVSQLLEVAGVDSGKSWEEASSNLRFAASVASFGMLLRDSKYKGNTSLDNVKSWATAAKGADLDGYRKEFIGLVDLAKANGGVK